MACPTRTFKALLYRNLMALYNLSHELERRRPAELVEPTLGNPVA
jgi:hypothetical protein